MNGRFLHVVAIALAFVLLAAFVFLNDFEYRTETASHNIRINAYRVYSDWYQFIGILRGLTLTNESFDESLDRAEASREKIRIAVDDLRLDSQALDKGTRENLESFLVSIEAGMDLGQEIVDNGRVLLEQVDLPEVYRDGRMPLSSLAGKDATEFMGSSSAYYYFQLVRRSKELNSLFDRIYVSKLEALLDEVADRSQQIRRKLFVARFGVLGATSVVVVLLIAQLFRLNRYLRGQARKTEEELKTAQSHLHEVQGFLKDARYQQSLFEITVGISHELNTPLGNCITLATYLEGLLQAYRESRDAGGLSEEPFLEVMEENERSLRILGDNLRQMKTQIDTFKLLSAVNEENPIAYLPLSRYVDDELATLARSVAPSMNCRSRLETGVSVELPVKADLLNRILRQLLENSRDHGEAASVTADFSIRGGNLRIVYTDDGLGVPKEALARLADPFYTTARGRKHMGLGLPIIVSLIRHKLRGSIKFFSDDSGFSAQIDLPFEFLGAGALTEL